MAYPANSDFISGEPGAAWWLVGIGEGRTYGYATQGETANKRIQRSLNEYFSGRESIAGNPLTVDGVIGSATLQKLKRAADEHARADSQGGYGEISSRLASDIARRTISQLSYRWALWLAYVRSDPTLSGRTWGDVVITANTRLPAFGQAPDDDRDAGGRDLLAVRWLLNVQDPPAFPSRSETRTPLGSTGPTPGTPQSTTVTPSATTGGSTGAALVPVTPAPSGVAPASRASSSVSVLDTEYAGVKGSYWLVGAALLGFGAIALSGDKRSGRRSRRSPAMRSRRRSRYSSNRRAR